MTEFTRPAVTIIIVSYNTCALLRQCLTSTLHPTLPLEVIVVDNASHDGSSEMVHAEFPGVGLIRNTANRGFAGATNQAITASMHYHTPYLLLLNPDAQLLPDALETLYGFMQAHPRVGCVGARLLYPDGSFQEAAWHFPTPWMTLFDLFPPQGPLFGRLQTSALNGRYQAEHGTEPFPVDHPLGAAMLIRRRTLEAVGPLDEGYWLYVEEVDWCRRAKLAGWSIWQVPQAQVVHVAGASSRQFRGRSLVALHRSRLRFFRKFEEPRVVNLHRRIMQLGMIWATIHSCWVWWRGHIPLDELRSRLASYGAVTHLAHATCASEELQAADGIMGPR
ncbi:MAG: glycosyltransferase family 2 protein [Herpetosiphonaceae bacterium]|nr:glycosyltransferase family 2 protein [Herpetosiphonaceae bacterium]